MRIFEQIRMILATILGLLFSVFTDSKHFILALVISFAFNIWAGMRSDGVSVTRCTKFSLSKFWKACIEFYVYVGIIYIIQGIMYSAGDKEEALVVIKTITYVFCYVYIQNGFKNVIIAYPTSKALRIIYHVIRFEFIRALPSNVQEIIERIEKSEKEKKEQDI